MILYNIALFVLNLYDVYCYRTPLTLMYSSRVYVRLNHDLVPTGISTRITRKRGYRAKTNAHSPLLTPYPALALYSLRYRWFAEMS